MAQQIMYPGQVNSPQTELASAITAVQTSIDVLDASRVPAAPNLIVIGSDETAETVLYTGKAGNTLTGCTRGFQGTAKTWSIGAKVARYFTAYDYDALRNNISDNNAKLIQAEDVTAELTQSLQVVNVTQNSRLKLQKAVGRTLVNLLGRDGNCESLAGFSASGASPITISTTQKKSGNSSFKQTLSGTAGYVYRDYSYPLDTTKQYILAGWVFIESYISGAVKFELYDYGSLTAARYTVNTNKATIGAWQFVYIKIPKANTLVGSGFRLLIGTGGSATNVAYYDDIRIYELTDAENTAIGTTITGDAIDAYLPYMDDIKPVEAPWWRKFGKNLLPPFTEWSLSPLFVVSDAYKMLLPANTSGSPIAEVRIAVVPNTDYTLTMGSSGGRNRIDGTTTGSIAGNATGNTRTFNSGGNTEIKIIFDKSSSLNASEIAFDRPQLELGTVATSFVQRNDDWLMFPALPLHGLADGSVVDTLGVDGDGRYIKNKRFEEVVLNGSLAWTFVTSYSGYKRVYAPLAGAVPNKSARAVKFNGNILSTSESTDLSMTQPDATYITATPNIVISISGADSGWGDGYTPSAAEIQAYFWGWKMNNGTFGTPYNGTGTKTWTRWDATSNTGAVTTVPTAIADVSYTPYRLVYQRAQSVVEQVRKEGSITLHEGDNLIEMGGGVIVRERANPVQNSTFYYINRTSVAGSNLRYRTNKILSIRRNEVEDWGWGKGSDSTAYGNERLSIGEANFDKTAVYPVTYLALDMYLLGSAPQSAVISYAPTLRPSLDSVAAATTENEKRIDALENAGYRPPPNTIATAIQSSKDATIGVYKDIDYTRLNGTLAMTSRLSTPDGNGFYKTMTWVYYDDTGRVAIRTVVWSILYDSDGIITSRTPSAV